MAETSSKKTWATFQHRCSGQENLSKFTWSIPSQLVLGTSEGTPVSRVLVPWWLLLVLFIGGLRRPSSNVNAQNAFQQSNTGVNLATNRRSASHPTLAATLTSISPPKRVTSSDTPDVTTINHSSKRHVVAWPAAAHMRGRPWRQNTAARNWAHSVCQRTDHRCCGADCSGSQTSLNLLRDAGPLPEKLLAAAEQELLESRLSVSSASNAATMGSALGAVWATSPSSINTLNRFWTFTTGQLEEFRLPTLADTICKCPVHDRSSLRSSGPSNWHHCQLPDRPPTHPTCPHGSRHHQLDQVVAPCQPRRRPLVLLALSAALSHLNLGRSVSLPRGHIHQPRGDVSQCTKNQRLIVRR